MRTVQWYFVFCTHTLADVLSDGTFFVSVVASDTVSVPASNTAPSDGVSDTVFVSASNVVLSDSVSDATTFT